MVKMFNLFKKNKERKLRCPRCSVKMDKIEKQEVVIDVCPGCNGMWLDDKEMDKIIEIGKQGDENENHKK